MQILKYQWDNSSGNWEPFFSIINENNFGKMKLINENINMILGRKRCVGYFKDGRHVSCPENRFIDNGWNCEECKEKDDYFLCIKCNGSKCINEKQRDGCIKNNYYIYLAAFDSILKVGISFQFRLLNRFIEQGADFAASIAMVKDGMEARKIESLIKERLNITDKVNGIQKRIFGDPNKSIKNIITSISKLKEIDEIRSYMIKPEIYNLSSYYKLPNIDYEPRFINIKDNIEIEGKIVAAKGPLILIEDDELFSINAHSMIGRDVIFKDMPLKKFLH